MIRILAVLLFAAFCAGCADRPPPKPEPCEVWVNDYHRRASDCVSREHVMRDILPPLGGGDQF